MAWKHLTLAAVVVLSAAAAGAQTDGPASTFTVTGTVKSVSNSSLTIASRGLETSFAVIRSTRFIGKGLANDLVLREPRLQISRALKPGDRVSVTYRQSAALPTAVEVRVVERAGR